MKITDFKVGDRVKVLRKFNGFIITITDRYSWVPYIMDETIGKFYKIKYISKDELTIVLDNNLYYPYYVLSNLGIKLDMLEKYL